MDEKEFLNQFGETFINDVRKQTILEMNKVLAGDYKAEAIQKLYAKLNHFSKEDIEIIKEISVTAIDSALFNVMFMFESSEDFIIGAVNDDEIVNLNDVSDGLGGEYYKWIDEYCEPNSED